MARVTVIGGGASGMMAALTAAREGAKVLLLEKNEKLGKKIYITGKGRCNVTNDCPRDVFFNSCVSNPKFLFSAYSSFSAQDTMALFSENGLALKTERGNRVFPASDRASDVTRTLERALVGNGVNIRLNTRATGLIIKDGKCAGVRLADGTAAYSDAAVIATGGLSYPSTGSTGDGLVFAREAGLNVTECLPSLVGIGAVTKDGRSLLPLSGLSLKNVSIRVMDGKKCIYSNMGEMVFTHSGVSGPLILSASAYCVRALSKRMLELFIDFKPALDFGRLDGRLCREFEENSNRILLNIMPHLVPRSLSEYILREAGIPCGIVARDITRGQRTSLLKTLKAFPLTLIRGGDYNGAVITQGGVSVKEIRPNDMAAKAIRGLYFCGEVLDLDALTGGFNLQIAWTTGHCAGKGAAHMTTEMYEI